MKDIFAVVKADIDLSHGIQCCIKAGSSSGLRLAVLIIFRPLLEWLR